MGVSITNTISQVSNLTDVDVSPLNNGDALIYNSSTGDWTATALPGGGDMLKATYDPSLRGVVDTSYDVSSTPLITRTSVASQGGLLINIDSATGDIARTTDGWIEDEKYGMYAVLSTAGFSAEFDSTVTRTGNFTVKVSTTDATGRGYVTNSGGSSASIGLQRLFIKVKPSTKYRTGCWIKTTNANTVFFRIQGYSITLGGGTSYDTATVTGTTDWTYYTTTFTTGGTIEYARFRLYNNIAGNVSDAWFDINSMTLEEVIEPVANSLVTPSPSLVSFTAVGSTDNIDQSQLSSAGSLSFSNVAQYQAQQFIPTKSKFTGVTLYKLADILSPTGTMTFSIVNDSADTPGTTTYATYTYSNAAWLALTASAEFTIPLPCNLVASTKYWIKMSYSVSSATDYPRIGAGTPASVYANGLFKYGTDGITYGVTFNGDAYFKTLYYKPTTNFKASQNNQSVSISADEDGFLDGSKIDLVNGIYTYSDSFTDAVLSTDNIYTSNKYPITISGGQMVLNGDALGSLPDVQPVMKINTGLTATSMTVSATLRQSKIQYSYDNVTYYDGVIQDTAGVILSTFTIVPNTNVVYLKFVKGTGNSTTYCYVNDLSISASLDVSSLSTLKNYPTNKDIIKAYSKSLISATTTATYRATKWGFPAIEYSATEYQFLDIDTTATSSVVEFSEDGTSYTTVADGANIALTSTTTPLVYVSHNITANRLYLSSNDYNAVGDKDGSNLQTVVYQVQSQGLNYNVEELEAQVESLRQAVYALQNP